MAVKKNPEFDNERLRLPLIFLGFFIVGSLITLSFSYKTKVEFASGGKDDQAVQDIPEQQEVIEEDKEEPVVQEVQELEVQETITEEIIETKSEDKDEKNVIDIIKIDKEPDIPAPPAEIVEYPEKEAGFPGGTAAMHKFLAENIKYPEVAMELGDAGRVFVEFVVNKDGSIEQVKILRGVSKEIDVEARRVVRKMPRWEPAQSNGEPVRARCRIPINFILQ
ncbi:MAG TPA: TonB family protein [Brumimicrobium sp.]|nr:TonB family protein [Brumimicrobium sp.]